METENNLLVIMVSVILKHNPNLLSDHKRCEELATNPLEAVKFICVKENKFSLQVIKCDYCGLSFGEPDKVMFHCIEADHPCHDYCLECFENVLDCKKVHRASINVISRLYYSEHHLKIGFDRFFDIPTNKYGAFYDEYIREMVKKYQITKYNQITKYIWPEFCDYFTNKVGSECTVLTTVKMTELRK